MKKRKIKWYGWKPDLPDARDKVGLLVAPPAVVPDLVDLRAFCPAVFNQANLGSCTANAISGACEFDLLKQQLPDFTPSRLFIYYNERLIEGTTGTDSGAQIRDGIKSIGARGFCDEKLWPYDIGDFAVKPNSACYTAAKQHTAIKYSRLVADINMLRQALATGFPFVFGFTVYDSFESQEVAQTGSMPMPDLNNEQILGGHAVMCVGYDVTKQVFIVRNSWGADWGDKGYFYMPFDYIQPNLTDDFWQVSLVT